MVRLREKWLSPEDTLPSSTRRNRKAGRQRGALGFWPWWYGKDPKRVQRFSIYLLQTGQSNRRIRGNFLATIRQAGHPPLTRCGSRNLLSIAVVALTKNSQRSCDLRSRLLNFPISCRRNCDTGIDRITLRQRREYCRHSWRPI